MDYLIHCRSERGSFFAYTSPGAAPEDALRHHLTTRKIIPVPVAWSVPDGRATIDLRKEAQQVGRLIEKVGDQFVVRHPEAKQPASTEQATPFRIGGIYRQQNGKLRYLREVPHWKPDVTGQKQVEAVHVENGKVRECSFGVADGARRLSDGRYPGRRDDPEYGSHLVPGELDVHGNPLTADKPLPAAKPATLADSTDPRDKAMLLRDGPAKDAPKRTPSPNVPASKDKPRTLHASPFAAFRSPDLTASSHQVHHLHGSAALT